MKTIRWSGITLATLSALALFLGGAEPASAGWFSHGSSGGSHGSIGGWFKHGKHGSSGSDGSSGGSY